MKNITSLWRGIPMWAVCAAVFAVAIGLRLHWLNQKHGVHMDEPSTVRIALLHVPYGDLPEGMEQGRTYSGAEAKRLFMRQLHSLGHDLAELRRDNHDHAHTNLYYSLFRVAYEGNTDYTLDGLKRRGGILNLLFFCGTFALIAMLMRELFGRNRLLVCVGLVAATWCTGALANTIFFRPYALQEMLLAGFALMMVRLVKGGGVPKAKWALGMGALTGALLLATYTSAIYVFFAFAALTAVLWLCGGWRSLLPLGGALAVAALVATAIYPNYFPGFFEDRSAGAAQSAFSGHLAFKVAQTLIATMWHLTENLFYAPIALMLAAITLCRRRMPAIRAEHRAALVLLCVTTLWTVGTLYAAPFRSLRYVMAGFPLLAVAVPLALSAIRRPNVRTCAAAAVVATYAVASIIPNEANYPETEIERGTTLRHYNLSVMEQTYPRTDKLFTTADTFVVAIGIDAYIHSMLTDFPDSAQFIFYEGDHVTPAVLQSIPAGTVAIVQNKWAHHDLCADFTTAGFQPIESRGMFNILRKQ